ncbi:MAG TPA: hypothetical protein VIS75_00130 [Chitinophagaceae bacterium]
MEVHAHTHPASGGTRKKWTHYLWEFLMLFLAVFCGFLAENQREHMIEHQREKVYINSLITDLKEDTATIRYVISFCIKKFHGMDTLAQLLNKDVLSNEEEKELYYLNSRHAASVLFMVFNERTIKQFLNSGNLRLVRKQGTSDSIMNYYGQTMDRVIDQEKVCDEMSKRLVFSTEDIFDHSASLKKMNTDSSFYRDIKQEKMKLITKDKNVLRKYSQMILTARSMLATYIGKLFVMEKGGENLLAFLENEYK